MSPWFWINTDWTDYSNPPTYSEAIMVGWSNLLNAVATAVEPVVMPSIEKGYVPDFLVRFGVRRQCGHRLQLLKQAAGSPEEAAKQKEKFVSDLKSMPIAIQQQAANQQHYEVPSELYELVLGPRLKYSSGLWPSTNSTFAESEDAMLEVYCERAQLEDGQNVVDLGCGWGSLSLFIAAKYPNSSITSISNSASQREFIEKRCQELGLKNVRVITGDINIFDLPDAEKGKHDRVCSIEMFEHMKVRSSCIRVNYSTDSVLFAKITEL
jgi:cyclopropane-fatty-acyl-phospholipid synthase